jgi:hypothetical protein
MICGCERKVETPQNPPTAAAEPPLIVPAPALPPPPIGRPELLQALEVARSAYAAGRPGPDQKLTGRPFSVRQAFGCSGVPAAQMEAGVAQWTWGPKHEKIEISITPADLTHTIVTADEAARWEAAEGYWLPRPWLKSDDCPATHAPAPSSALQAVPAPTPRWTDGLAAVFEKEGSRVGRREGKAFTLTVRDGDAPLPPPGGYRLVIEGRFAAFASGRAIRCRSSNAGDRPVCIAAALIDRVAIEGADGKPMKEWRLG